MTKSEIALREACVLAEEMIYKDMLAEFEAQPFIMIPEGQPERIHKLIYGEDTEPKANTRIKEKKTSSRKIKTILLIAAMLIILFGVTATAFNPIRDFIIKIYRECTEIVFDVTSKDDYLFAEYSYIPEGYIKVKDERVKVVSAQSIVYSNGKSIIKISTLKNTDSTTIIDTENAKTGEVMINGNKGYYSITKTSIMLVWSTGKFNHCLTATLNDKISLDAIVKIAQSRRPIK